MESHTEKSLTSAHSLTRSLFSVFQFVDYGYIGHTYFTCIFTCSFKYSNSWRHKLGHS